MSTPELPPEVAAQLAELRRRLANLERASGRLQPPIGGLADVDGTPTANGEVMAYNRETGRWQPQPIGFPGQVTWGAGDAIPSGRWLPCDGAAVSRTDYADLFAAIGVLYGAGDGSTTFNLPNLGGRFVLGAGSPEGIAESGGEREHALTSAENAAHSHSLPARYTFTGAHVHAGVGGGVAENSDPTDGPTSPEVRSAADGDGDPHNNMPPYMTLWAYISY